MPSTLLLTMIVLVIMKATYGILCTTLSFASHTYISYVYSWHLSFCRTPNENMGLMWVLHRNLCYCMYIWFWIDLLNKTFFLQKHEYRSTVLEVKGAHKNKCMCKESLQSINGQTQGDIKSRFGVFGDIPCHGLSILISVHFIETT